MTREEAIRILECTMPNSSMGCGASDEEIEEAMMMAIKTLEQELILDKVRTEIEQMDFDFGDFYDHTSTIREMVLEVIDKCRNGYE